MRGSPQLFADFRGGLNRRDAPYNVGANEARDLLNLTGSERGPVRKREGSVSLATLAATSVFAAEGLSTLIAAYSTKLAKVSTTGTVTDLKAGLTAGTKWEFASLLADGGQGPYFGMNNVDTPQQWDGAAGSTSNWTAGSGTLPNGSFVISHKNRLWVADGSRVYFSAVGLARTWPAENVVVFDEGDGSNITGIGTCGDLVVVFKERKTWAIYDLDTGANRKISSGVGCVSHRSIADTPQGCLFLARDNVYRTNGSTVEPVGNNVTPLLDDIPYNKLDDTAGIYFDDHYYLSFSQGDVLNELTLDFHLTLGSWWLHSFHAEQWALWRLSSDLELIGANGSKLMRCLQANSLQDDGSDYPCYWASAFHTFGTPSLQKRIRRIHFDGVGRIEASTAMDFLRVPQFEDVLFVDTDEGFFGVDDGGLFGVEDGSVYGGGDSVGELEINSVGVCRAISVMFGNTLSEDFEVDSYTIAMQMRKD